jgi:hypothetical protein
MNWIIPTLGSNSVSVEIHSFWQFISLCLFWGFQAFFTSLSLKTIFSYLIFRFKFSFKSQQFIFMLDYFLYFSVAGFMSLPFLWELNRLSANQLTNSIINVIILFVLSRIYDYLFKKIVDQIRKIDRNVLRSESEKITIKEAVENLNKNGVTVSPRTLSELAKIGILVGSQKDTLGKWQIPKSSLGKFFQQKTNWIYIVISVLGGLSVFSGVKDTLDLARDYIEPIFSGSKSSLSLTKIRYGLFEEKKAIELTLKNNTKDDILVTKIALKNSLVPPFACGCSGVCSLPVYELDDEILILKGDSNNSLVYGQFFEKKVGFKNKLRGKIENYCGRKANFEIETSVLIEQKSYVSVLFTIPNKINIKEITSENLGKSNKRSKDGESTKIKWTTVRSEDLFYFLPSTQMPSAARKSDTQASLFENQIPKQVQFGDSLYRQDIILSIYTDQNYTPILFPLN